MALAWAVTGAIVEILQKAFCKLKFVRLVCMAFTAVVKMTTQFCVVVLVSLQHCYYVMASAVYTCFG